MCYIHCSWYVVFFCSFTFNFHVCFGEIVLLFRTESVFHTEFDFVWVDRTKPNSVRPKCSSHLILFPQLFFTISKWIFYHVPFWLESLTLTPKLIPYFYTHNNCMHFPEGSYNVKFSCIFLSCSGNIIRA